MNTRLITLSLIALLGLGSMGASGSLSPKEQKKLLEQQHQALVQEELTLGQTFRQLRDQTQSLLEQLRALNPKGGTTKDWMTLWQDYHQYKVSDSEKDKDVYEDKYKDKLEDLEPKHGEHAFKGQVKTLLTALEAVQQQQDALAQSWAVHNQKKRQLNKDKQNFNQQNGQH